MYGDMRGDVREGFVGLLTPLNTILPHPMPLRPKGSGLGIPNVINPSLMDTDMEILPIPAFWRVGDLDWEVRREGWNGMECVIVGKRRGGCGG